MHSDSRGRPRWKTGAWLAIIVVAGAALLNGVSSARWHDGHERTAQNAEVLATQDSRSPGSAREMTIDPALTPFHQLVGTWTTEATHPKAPGVIVRGTTVIEWLAGERFLIVRADTDHKDFPDAISIIGRTEHDRVDPGSKALATAADDRPLSMQYFDERGVFRILETRLEGATWRIWRDAAGFSQRYSGTLTDGGATIVGTWQLREDDVHWADDLAITYRRQP